MIAAENGLFQNNRQDGSAAMQKLVETIGRLGTAFPDLAKGVPKGAGGSPWGIWRVGQLSPCTITI
jgi:hypothetical protein